MQIIQAGPSARTLRQKAFDEGMQGMIDGYKTYSDDVNRRDETLRQQAMAVGDKRFALQKEGYDTSHLSDDQIASGMGIQKPKEIGFRNPFSGDDEEPVKKADLFGKRTAEYQAKYNQDQEDRRFKRQGAELDQSLKRSQIYKNYKGRVPGQTGAETPGEMGGEQLKAPDVAKFNEGNQIPAMLQDVKSTIANNKDMFGPVAGRIASINPYNEKGQTADAQIRASSQAFGRFMEGGVLRKEDEDKYRKMFPELSDTPEVAENKLAIVERLLTEKQNSTMSALKGSGYNVSAINKNHAVPEVPTVLSGATGSWGNEAKAKDPVVLKKQLQGMSRDEKIKLLQGR